MTFAATEPEVLELLRRSTLFGDLPDGELTLVASRLEAVRFAAGDTIVREGDQGHRAFLIASGEAAVVAHDLIGEQVILTVFRPGATFVG